MVEGERRLLAIDNVGALVFGPGAALRCADDLKALGARSVFLVTTPPTRFLCEPLIQALGSAGCGVTLWHDLAGEPTVLSPLLGVSLGCRRSVAGRPGSRVRRNCRRRGG